MTRQTSQRHHVEPAEDAPMATDHLTANQLRDRFRAPDVTTTTPDGDYYLDVDLAVAAYVEGPDRFHVATDDNPDGDPVVALVLEDGPWWVPQDDRSDPEFLEDLGDLAIATLTDHDRRRLRHIAASLRAHTRHRSVPEEVGGVIEGDAAVLRQAAPEPAASGLDVLRDALAYQRQDPDPSKQRGSRPVDLFLDDGRVLGNVLISRAYPSRSILRIVFPVRPDERISTFVETSQVVGWQPAGDYRIGALLAEARTVRTTWDIDTREGAEGFGAWLLRYTEHWSDEALLNAAVALQSAGSTPRAGLLGGLLAEPTDTRGAPYRPGDRVRVLCWDRRSGTTLAPATVVACVPSVRTGRTGRWALTVEDPTGNDDVRGYEVSSSGESEQVLRASE